MKLHFLILTSVLALTTLAFQAQLQAQEELGQSEEVYVPKAPAKSLRPPAVRPKPPASPTTSLRPFSRPGPLQELTSAQILALQALPCPEDEKYCHGPSRNLVTDRKFFNPRCSEFINPAGGYEETGIIMLEAMREVEKANQTYPYKQKNRNCSFEKSFDFGRACPNFKYLSPLQKDHVWVWLWASVAQAESSCDPTVDAEGIDNEELGRKNIADGLYGLEYSADTRKLSDRDPRFCPHTAITEEVGGTKNLKFQSRCAASIMFNRQCGSNIVDENSYWEKLRSNQRKITLLIQRHPLCKTGTNFNVY